MTVEIGWLERLSPDQVIVTVGVIATAYYGFRSVQVSKQTRRHTEELKETSDTGNDKDLGTTVHDLAQTQEVILAQLHTTTADVLDLSAKIDAHLEMSGPVIAAVEHHLREHEEEAP